LGYAFRAMLKRRSTEKLPAEQIYDLYERQARYDYALEIASRLFAYARGYLKEYIVQCKIDPSGNPIKVYIEIYWDKEPEERKEGERALEAKESAEEVEEESKEPSNAYQPQEP